VKLPEILFHANIEGDTLVELQAQILDFLRFLRKNQRAFFLSSYHVQENVENSSDKQFYQSVLLSVACSIGNANLFRWIRYNHGDPEATKCSF
ncbi:nuA4 complex subunit EAF3, partial [Trifolium pratense]